MELGIRFQATKSMLFPLCINCTSNDGCTGSSVSIKEHTESWKYDYNQGIRVVLLEGPQRFGAEWKKRKKKILNLELGNAKVLAFGFSPGTY